MQRIVYILAALLMAGVFANADDDHDKRRKRAERRLHSLEERAKKIPIAAKADDLAGFLRRETQRLIDRSRTLSPPSYKFEQMLAAIDDLLDAREDLLDAQREKHHKEADKHHREDTARRLERAYFRVQQGGYFGRLSGDKHASEYILRSRQLYQQGRAAYDRREYRRANKVATASTELLNVLENLAQAAVRKPEPPVLQ